MSTRFWRFWFPEKFSPSLDDFKQLFHSLNYSSTSSWWQCTLLRSAANERCSGQIPHRVLPLLLVGLLTEALPGPLIGIIGYDLFRRAVVEMKPLTKHQSDKPNWSATEGNSPEPNFSVSLHDPRSYAPVPDEDEILFGKTDKSEDSEEVPTIPWKPLRMVRCLLISRAVWTEYLLTQESLRCLVRHTGTVDPSFCQWFR